MTSDRRRTPRAPRHAQEQCLLHCGVDSSWNQFCASMSQIGQDDASGAVAAIKPKVQVTNIPVKGIFGVDFVPEGTVVTHMLTHEQCKLDGCWKLQTDDDEVCGVLEKISGGDDDVLDLEDPALFSKRVVMQDGHQDLMVIETHQGKRSKYDLDSLTTPHKIAAVVARVGTTAAKFSFVCVFKKGQAMPTESCLVM